MRKKRSKISRFKTQTLMDELVRRGEYEVDNYGQCVIYTGIDAPGFDEDGDYVLDNDEEPLGPVSTDKDGA